MIPRNIEAFGDWDMGDFLGSGVVSGGWPLLLALTAGDAGLGALVEGVLVVVVF